MSYCRFSSDDWMCDVYVYDDISGWWNIHVASKRPLNIPKNTESFQAGNVDAWLAAHNKQMQALDGCERESINLPGAGESFSEPTAKECAQRLRALKQIGFNVPDYAIDALEAEEEE